MSHRPPYLAICIACSLAWMGGCEALTDYRQLPVLVQDAETGKPVAGAQVCITYPHAQDFRVPAGSTSRTGDDGIAHTVAAPFGSPGPVIQASAPGYMDGEKWLSIKTVQALEPASRSRKVGQGPAAIAVEVFAEPEPTVELVIPTGFRGKVMAEVKIQDDFAYPPGQRCFAYAVPASGMVQITGPPLLRRVFGAEFRARYADGPPLAWKPNDSTVGWWWLGRDGEEYRFLVGTEMEYKTFGTPSAQEEKRGGSSGNQNGGRRHRRRNSSPSDADSN